jgi:RNA polymerase sigma-70 factor (ECF subfamily)
MAALAESDDELGRFRGYLSLLARHEVSTKLRAAIDISGVVQQSLLDAYRSPARQRTEAETAAWLRAIFRNNLADEVRRRSARKRGTDRQRSLDVTDGGPPAQHSSPSQRAIRAEELMRLAGALAKLPETQRRAVEMHHLQGRPLAEIAEALETTKPAIAGLLHRGLKALRNELDAEKKG